MEKLAQQQRYSASAATRAPPRDVPSSAVASGTTVRMYYATFPPVDKSHHPAHSPSTTALCISLSHPNSSSPIYTNKASQEPLRHGASLGFSVNVPFNLSNNAKAPQRTVTIGGRECFSYFRLPKGKHGIIDPKAMKCIASGIWLSFRGTAKVWSLCRQTIPLTLLHYR